MIIKDDNNNNDLHQIPAKRITISDEGPMASGMMCYPIEGNAASRRRWCESHDLRVDKWDRVFALVEFGVHDHAYMDAITGSLYDIKSGRCYSSDSLRVGRLTRDHELARNILLSTKRQRWR